MTDGASLLGWLGNWFWAESWSSVCVEPWSSSDVGNLPTSTHQSSLPLYTTKLHWGHKLLNKIFRFLFFLFFYFLIFWPSVETTHSLMTLFESSVGAVGVFCFGHYWWVGLQWLGKLHLWKISSIQNTHQTSTTLEYFSFWILHILCNLVRLGFKRRDIIWHHPGVKSVSFFWISRSRRAYNFKLHILSNCFKWKTDFFYKTKYSYRRFLKLKFKYENKNSHPIFFVKFWCFVGAE